MIIKYEPQLSQAWFDLHIGKISGSRFGQVISGRKNKLIYELLNEVIDNKFHCDDFMNEDMQYGIDNEDLALRHYEEREGIEVIKVGAIMSETLSNHMASPDGLSECKSIVQEVKSTQNGAIHLQRIFEGNESSYTPQIINYFAVAPEIKEVHFISFCPNRPERPLHVIKYKREFFSKEIELGLIKVKEIQNTLESMLAEYQF